MAAHAKDALRSPSISEIFNLPLAVPTPEAGRTERLIARQNRQVLNLIAAGVAAVCAVVAYQRAITEEKEIRIRVQQSVASVAPEAVEMPPEASYYVLAKKGRYLTAPGKRPIGSRGGIDNGRMPLVYGELLTKLECLALF